MYSFSDTRAQKIAFYSYYVLSGAGCAWTAFAEVAVDTRLTVRCGDQYVTDEAGVFLVALWFHGVSQSDFTGEYLWPLWEPDLEVPTQMSSILHVLVQQVVLTARAARC